MPGNVQQEGEGQSVKKKTGVLQRGLLGKTDGKVAREEVFSWMAHWIIVIMHGKVKQ